MQDEKILTAAIWYKDFVNGLHNPANITSGLVLYGYRHVHIVSQMAVLQNKSLADCGEYVHGFLTNNGRFVDRKEAAKIFVGNGGVLGYSKDELYSEDLY